MPHCREAALLYLAFLDFAILTELYIYTVIGVEDLTIEAAETLEAALKNYRAIPD